MLNVEHQCYIKCREEFLRKYLGKYVVIKGEILLGVYDNEYDAVNETIKSHDLGSFLVRQVVAEPRVAKVRARL